MRKNAGFLSTICVVVLFGAAAMAKEDAPPAQTVQKPIKILLNAIRYKKFDLAAEQLAYNEMAKRLLEKTWEQLSETDKKEVATSLAFLIRERSFSKGHETFKHLDAVVYDTPTQPKSDVICKSTIVVHRNYKKTELVIDWVLTKADGAWKIVDMILLGESTLAGIREDEVEPLLEEGGVPTFMKALREVVQNTKD